MKNIKLLTLLITGAAVTIFLSAQAVTKLRISSAEASGSLEGAGVTVGSESSNETVVEINAPEAISAVTVSGLTIEAGNFRVVGEYFMADICYDRPDEADWLLGVPNLELKERSVTAFSVGLIEYKEGATFAGKRCDEVSFPIEGDEDLSAFQIVIPRLETSWSDTLDCGEAQSKLDAADTGIVIECIQEEGISGPVLVGKPDTLSEEAAHRLIGDAFIDIAEGPWVLPGSFNE